MQVVDRGEGSCPPPPPPASSIRIRPGPLRLARSHAEWQGARRQQAAGSGAARPRCCWGARLGETAAAGLEEPREHAWGTRGEHRGRSPRARVEDAGSAPQRAARRERERGWRGAGACVGTTAPPPPPGRCPSSLPAHRQLRGPVPPAPASLAQEHRGLAERRGQEGLWAHPARSAGMARPCWGGP